VVNRALFSNITGYSNTASGYFALTSNSAGFFNTANGLSALESNTTGILNTANGVSALRFNTTGFNNTANGVAALGLNTTGNSNTASGSYALERNDTGSFNTATGMFALQHNNIGGSNTATGFHALWDNTTGGSNTADGVNALTRNTNGQFNTAAGVNALTSNTAGSSNTANGLNALGSNNTGNNNTAQGANALVSNTSGNSNIALGVGGGGNLTTGDNNIDIGNAGVAGEANTIRIGTQGTQTKTFIAGISGTTVAGGVGVIVGANGKLGTVVSSGRYKDEIEPMGKASEAILELKPVTFRYKRELDPDGILQFGLVAEQVEKVNPDLVARDEEGKAYTVRYDQVNAMLLNEFLKEHRKVEALEAKMVQQQSTNADQRKAIQALSADLKEQATQIQKVSAQLEASKPAPQQVVLNIP